MSRARCMCREEIDTLKNEVPVGEIAERRGLDLQSNIVMRCPKCLSETAEIAEDEKSIACGSCRFRGDAIKILEVTDRTNFNGAVRALAAIAGELMEIGRRRS